MQVFGNVATQPEVKKSKASGKAYFEFRLAESQRGVDAEPTWYTVRVMKDSKPLLDRGDFVKVTGKLRRTSICHVKASRRARCSSSLLRQQRLPSPLLWRRR